MDETHSKKISFDNVSPGIVSEKVNSSFITPDEAERRILASSAKAITPVEVNRKSKVNKEHANVEHARLKVTIFLRFSFL